MNKSYLILYLFALFLLQSFSALAQVPMEVECGSEWINIHKDNPNLVGVYVSDVPDNVYDAKAYKGKHPVSVTYLFQNGQAHSVEYSPSGQVQDGIWFKMPKERRNFGELITELKTNVVCKWYVNAKTPN